MKMTFRKLVTRTGVALKRLVRRLWRAPLAHREAVRLAQVMWRLSYRDAAPQWQPCDDTAAVISQIDNMHAGVLEDLETARKDVLIMRRALQEITAASILDAAKWEAHSALAVTTPIAGLGEPNTKV